MKKGKKEGGEVTTSVPSILEDLDGIFFLVFGWAILLLLYYGAVQLIAIAFCLNLECDFKMTFMRFCNMEFGCSCIILMDVASVQFRPVMRHLSQVLKDLK